MPHKLSKVSSLSAILILKSVSMSMQNLSANSLRCKRMLNVKWIVLTRPFIRFWKLKKKYHSGTNLENFKS